MDNSSSSNILYPNTFPDTVNSSITVYSTGVNGQKKGDKTKGLLIFYLVLPIVLTILIMWLRSRPPNKQNVTKMVIYFTMLVSIIFLAITSLMEYNDKKKNSTQEKSLLSNLRKAVIAVDTIVIVIMLGLLTHFSFLKPSSTLPSGNKTNLQFF